MVASTPEKLLFEDNFPSNSQPLFFEFALEPTPVSFTSSSTPIRHSKRRKVLSIGSRMVFGLLITALIMGSGILNNELLMGKSVTQANLGWMPSWSENVPASAATTTAANSLSETTTAVTIASKTTDRPSNPEPVFVTAKTNNDFSATVVAMSNPIEPNLLETIPNMINPDTEIKNPTEPKETTMPMPKPVIKQPVTRSDVKLSKPVMEPKTARPNKSEIISDAFHTITAASAMDGKKIFIKFGAKWCLPCKMMEANVFPDPEISQLLEKNYHTLTVDVDNIDGINLRQFFQVEAIPSFIVLDDQQNIMGKYGGAKRIEELRSILGNMAP